MDRSFPPPRYPGTCLPAEASQQRSLHKSDFDVALLFECERLEIRQPPNNDHSDRRMDLPFGVPSEELRLPKQTRHSRVPSCLSSWHAPSEHLYRAKSLQSRSRRCLREEE